MNVYVRELSSALARLGVECEVFTRADGAGYGGSVAVEPGFRVHYVPAGPPSPVAKESLPELVPEWTAGVAARLEQMGDGRRPIDAIHANYWLSGVAGHTLKHDLDVPLIATFHTLDRVKADASPEELVAAEPARRAHAEAEVVGCSDAVLASCSVEAEQLIDLYDADPARIATVAPGVDHAFFGPGDRVQARRAVGLDGAGPVVLFVGRIQPLKGLTVAVQAVASLPSARLVVIGGPSGPHGASELASVRALIKDLRLDGRVRMMLPQRHEILSTYYRAADVCVVPSHSESFGLVALEAGACGVPVVAAAVGGLTTLVDDGLTGFLVEGRDPSDYAKPLAELLGDPVLASRMGQAAARRARFYTWRSAARQLWTRVEKLTAGSLVACG